MCLFFALLFEFFTLGVAVSEGLTLVTLVLSEDFWVVCLLGDLFAEGHLLTGHIWLLWIV